MLNPLRVFRLFGNVSRGVEASYRARGEEASEYPHQVFRRNSRALQTTHNDRSQFHPAGAPVPLSFVLLLVSIRPQLTTGFVIHTCRSEDKFCRTEPVSIMDSNREPDKAEEEVEHENKHREAEHALVPLWREVIDRDRYD